MQREMLKRLDALESKLGAGNQVISFFSILMKRSRVPEKRSGGGDLARLRRMSGQTPHLAMRLSFMRVILDTRVIALRYREGNMPNGMNKMWHRLELVQNCMTSESRFST